MSTETTNRRDFIKKTAIIAASMAAYRLPLFANGCLQSDYPLHNIPVNKNIDPQWVRSLYNRGMATAYAKSKNELKYLGMPVGGLHSGTVYVGGDGRLWLWQIYNETIEGAHEGIDPKTVNWNDGTAVRKIRPRDGSAYVEPAIADNRRVLEQGFAIKVVQKGKTLIKELNEESWDEVVFEPAYPMATISYSSKSFPLKVALKVYSPFIPLDAANSALPATVLKVEVRNLTDDAVEVSVLGWMENGANKLSAKENGGQRVNTINKSSSSISILSAFEAKTEELKQATDHGTLCFALHQSNGTAQASINPWPITEKSFTAPSTSSSEAVDAPDKLVGGIFTSKHLQKGGSFVAAYSICWHFNQPHPKLKKLVKDAEAGFFYGAKFKDAGEVSAYLQSNFDHLCQTTELWSTTWNDSSLPHWFLERSFINVATLATANTYRFADGRFWSWEGVGACAGTCTHVWQYAHSVARLFPELERGLREGVDLGTGFKEESGAILFRGENETHPAIDGQAGTILRFYREHQMSTDSAFLQRNWPKIKKAIQFMLDQDKNGDGMTDTPMENTLDAVWEGEIAWIVGLCIAAARAGEQMAKEMNDQQFASTCGKYATDGSRNMEQYLFNGEYFIHRPDALQGRKKLGSYNTCHIDQVYGQSWAFQVGLPRVVAKEKTISALKALWKYNFTPDVGPYIKTHVGSRPYALAGEGGMIMNTNPHNEPKPYGEDVTWQLGYFHECMSGFEHQVAAHFMAEGMVEEALILTRMIHDRYHGAKRNPFNEIECSDHYARAMASYGTFISACGFEYHGPNGYIKFAPKWNKESFKAPFTAAAGWGTYAQNNLQSKQNHQIALKYGELELKAVHLEKLKTGGLANVSAMLGNKNIPLDFNLEGNIVAIRFKNGIKILKNEILQIHIS